MANAFKKITLDLTNARVSADVTPTGIQYFDGFTIKSSDATVPITGQTNTASDDTFDIVVDAVWTMYGKKLFITHAADPGKTLVIYMLVVF
tara:strand:- start:237 stop:509 length:273 start_codon:yes stop_codon:yes gene_type:complete